VTFWEGELFNSVVRQVKMDARRFGKTVVDVAHLVAGSGGGSQADGIEQA
jgi:hypothetical protein